MTHLSDAQVTTLTSLYNACQALDTFNKVERSYDDTMKTSIYQYQLLGNNEALTSDQIEEWYHVHSLKDEIVRIRAINEATKPKRYLRRGNQRWLLDAYYW